MTFEAPEWFLLLAVLLLVGWFWRDLQLWRPLRVLCLLLLTLILVEPKITRVEDRLDLWVLLDRSASTEDFVDKGLPEWKEILSRSKPSRKDQLRFVDYAGEVSEQGEGETAVYSGSRKLTRTNLALQNVLALAEEDRPTRVLVFTDGYSTEPLGEATDQLLQMGVPLDYRLLRDEVADDFLLARLELPTRTQVAEPFVIGVTVRGHADVEVPLQILRNGQLLSETVVLLENGVGKVEFTDRLGLTGANQYEARIIPEEDAHPGNNLAKKWIEVTGGPRILMVSKYADDPLAKVLREQGFSVEVEGEPALLKMGRLAGARAVVLNNIPAHEIPGDFLKALPFYVKEQAGALLMVGGKHSFGAGGYFESAVDPLLPVSMELKNEHRKLAVAMAIVMDRSGSMGASVGGGAGGKSMTKMDLANHGAAKAIELLGASDYISVAAVDSTNHPVVPMTQIKNKKKQLTQKVLRVKSSGGGIYVYVGLKAGWEQLQKAKTGTRHMILFSDAADSVEEGAYKRLIKEVTDDGGSVSVIGLGSKSDSDAMLLEDIAKRGNGRIFFSQKAVDIPKLFAQETVAVARSTFVEEPVGAMETGNWAEISPKPLEWLSEVDGYNLSYLRDDASAALISKDEYKAPLVSHARRGIGRTMAVSFPLGGEFSERVRSWEDYGNFTQTLSRWLIGQELPPGLGLRHKIEGTRLTIDLLYDPEEWGVKFAQKPPKIKLVEGEGGETGAYELTWKRMSPGHFSVSRDLEEGALVRGAIQAGVHALPFGPVVAGASAEWAFDPIRLEELRVMSNQTGGRELLKLSDAWVRPTMEVNSDSRLPLLITLFLCVLLDALVTRTGWVLPKFRMPKPLPADGDVAVIPAQKAKKIKKAAAVSTPEVKPTKAPSFEKADRVSKGAGRSARFDRAKRRK